MNLEIKSIYTLQLALYILIHVFITQLEHDMMEV